MSRLGVTLPLLNNTIRKIAELTVATENAGFDTAFDFQYCRNVFTGLSRAALETSRIQLGTGLAPIIPTDAPWGGRPLVRPRIRSTWPRTDRRCCSSPGRSRTVCWVRSGRPTSWSTTCCPT